jgi:hypothetical protein
LRIGVGESLRVVGLLERLALQQRDPTGPDEAAPWLAPLVCTTPAQQANLLQHLRAFERLRTPSSIVPSSPVAPRPPEQPASLARWIRAVLAFAALLVVLSLVFDRIAGPAPDESRPQNPIDGGEKSLPTFSVKENYLVAAAAAASVPLMVWVVVVRLRRRSGAALSRLPYDGGAAHEVQPLGRMLGLFDPQCGTDAGGWSRSTAAACAAGFARTHALMRSRRIDVRASAAATRRAAGRPVFVLCPESLACRDYPLLLDAQSPGDHLTVLGPLHCCPPAARGRALTCRYLYDADPRFVRTDTPLPQLLTLEALARAVLMATWLIVLGDADGFLQPFGAQVEPWVETALSAWRAMVLLTPVPLRRWSWRERGSRMPA